MDWVNTNGEVELIFMEILLKENVKDKVFGYQIYMLKNLIFTKDLMMRIEKMGLVFINGQIELLMKGILKMI